jgi:VanZ family protein
VAQEVVRRRSGSGFLRHWLPVLAYVAVIFAVSSQPYLGPPFQFENSDKVMHVLEYLGLGLLVGRALRGSRSDATPLAVGLAAIVIGMVVGASDELYQRGIPGRDSNPRDFLADSAGVVLAQIVRVTFRD